MRLAMSEEQALPSDEESLAGTRDWPHAPPHRLREAGVYFVTSRAAGGRHWLDTEARRDWFQNLLFCLAAEEGWRLEAWAVLSNHYHLVAHSPRSEAGGSTGLSRLVRKLHSLATKELNRQDGTPGRSRLWQNFRDTQLTLQRGYLARLHYVHQNAVHHGLVAHGSQWKWCSAQAFKNSVTPAWLKTITRFKFDAIAREDGE